MNGIAAAILVAGAMAIAAPESLAARSQEPAAVRFEVASVKENTSPERRASRRFMPGGRVEIRNMSLRMLVGFAYGIDTSAEDFRLSGGPEDLLKRRFDINAVAPADSLPTPSDLVRMLRALLAERFALTTHTETRSMPVFALTVAREGRLGPGLRPSQHNCREWAGSPLETEPKDENGHGLCGPSQAELLPGGVRRRYAGTIATLAQLIQRQATELRDRLVVDMTGLSGSYQWELVYSQTSLGSLGAEPDANLPSVFTAFREQLGLKLESKTAPVEIRIIDSVSLPSPN